jgi:ADP-heptose:LPS heptosyltransferase
MIELTNIIERHKYLKKIIYLLCDIYFGIIRKACSTFPYKSANTAIIALHNIGDSVFSIAALKEIVKNYPLNKITIVCFPENKPIYKIVLKEINYLLIGRNEILFNGRYVKSSARKKIRTIKPSTIFDLTGLAFLVYSIRAGEIIGMSKRQFKCVYNKFSPIRKKPHLIDAYLDVVRQKFRIEDSSIEKIFPIKINPNGKLLIHPFAGWRAKEWNLEKFIRLAQMLSVNNKVAFVVPLGSIKSEFSNQLNYFNIEIIETESIDELLSIIKDCLMMISNDSGPVYLANLLGKPTFTIYGPTNPDFSIPFGEYHGYIQKQIKCSPGKDEQYCFTNAGRTGCPSFECMNQLPPDEVYSSIKKFMNNILFKKDELQRQS